MKNYILYLTIFFSLFTGSVLGQYKSVSQKMEQQLTASSYHNYHMQYGGTPFYSNDWVNASVSVLSGEMYTNLKIKYDLYKDEFIYYNEALKKLLIIDSGIITDVRIFDKAGIELEWVTKHCVDSIRSCEFYFVYHSDSISLYTKRKKKIEKNNSESRSSNDLGAYYTVSKNQLLVNHSLITVPKGKRALASLFPSNKKAILSYTSKEHLKVKNINDLSKIIAKVNELEKQNKSVYIEKRKWEFWK